MTPAASDFAARPIWVDTAVYPPLPKESLGGDRSTEIAIVGGGFTGLAAAHHLAEAGIDCLLLEAGEIGAGASGRTAGMAGTRYKKNYHELAAHYGLEAARRLHELLHEGLATIERLVQRYAIAEAFSRYGQLIPAHTTAALEALGADVDWLASRLADKTPEILGRDTMARMLGSDGYRGGWYDRRGGAVQPVNLLRGLAHGLRARGVPIFTGLSAQGLQDNGREVVISTAEGRIVARQAIIATNAYTPEGLAGSDLARRVVPVASSIVVTEPLSENVAKSVLPAGAVASDTKRLLHAFRRLPDNRLLFSGRADITGRRSAEAASYALLDRALTQTFPQVDARISHRWAGFVAVTRDSFPHLGRLGPRIVYSMGYNGRGVVLAHLLGRFAAELAAGGSPDVGPMGPAGFRRWPFHGLRIPAMQVMAAIYNAQDRKELRRN